MLYTVALGCDASALVSHGDGCGHSLLLEQVGSERLGVTQKIKAASRAVFGERVRGADEKLYFR